MKNIAVFLGLVVLFFALVACGDDKKKEGDEVKKENVKAAVADSEKMKEYIEDLTVVANSASEDGVIDDSELKEIQEFVDSLNELQEKMDKKKEEDSKYKADADDYESENKAEIDKMMESFMAALTKLTTCEGFEKIKV
jgi:hypothetical protein